MIFVSRRAVNFGLLLSKQRLVFESSSDNLLKTINRPALSIHNGNVQQTSNTVDEYGNWTLSNAKQKLNQYKVMNSITDDFRYKETGPDHKKTFTAEMDIFISDLNRTITAKECGSTKSAASGLCAWSLVRQLYHLGLIGAFDGSMKSERHSSSKTNTTQNTSHSVYQVAISPEMVTRLEDCLQQLNLLPNVKSNPQAEVGDSGSYFVVVNDGDQMNVRNETSTAISWSPPRIDWHTWHGKEMPVESGSSIEEYSAELQREHLHRLAMDDKLRNVRKMREALPIFTDRQKILKLVSENPVTIVRSATGSGKTTQIAQYILDDHIAAGRGAQCNIAVTQPRRISATSVAGRVANERNEPLGQSVGYSVRFDAIVPRPFASILFCTVGMLLRKLENGLNGVTHVIIDEVHERSVDIDFLLGMVRELSVRHPELRVILMSATIESSLYSDYFGGCPVIDVEGRMYPVEQYFLEDCRRILDPLSVDSIVSMEDSVGSEATSNREEEKIDYAMIVDLLRYINEQNQPGDVLVFLPGWANILEMKEILSEIRELSDGHTVLPCHSMVPFAEQQKIFAPAPRGTRKIILSSSIAESSITIESIVYVIDSCKARRRTHSIRNNSVAFSTVWASQSNVQQRKGRAGRVQPGVCFTLCSRKKFDSLAVQPLPDIFCTPLHSLILRTKLMGVGNAQEFLSSLIEPPMPNAVREAENLLKDLGALDSQSVLTPLGKTLAQLPIDPRIGKMMILGNVLRIGDLMTSLASFTDPEMFVTDLDQRRLTDEQIAFGGDRFSDHMAKAKALDTWRNTDASDREAFCQSVGIHYPTLDLLSKTKSQLYELMIRAGFSRDIFKPIPIDLTESSSPQLDIATALLCIGLYPNICRHKSKRSVCMSDCKSAKMQSSSVLNSINIPLGYPYPFFTFDEKLRTSFTSCKQLTMVAPIHVLLFGSREIEIVDETTVCVDRWLRFVMDPYHVTLIRALRPAIERLIMIASQNPSTASNLDTQMANLIEVVRDLCAMNAGDHNIDRFKLNLEHIKHSILEEKKLIKC